MGADPPVGNRVRAGRLDAYLIYAKSVITVQYTSCLHERSCLERPMVADDAIEHGREREADRHERAAERIRGRPANSASQRTAQQGKAGEASNLALPARLGHDKVVRFPTPDDPELFAAVTRYVGRWSGTRIPPRYENLLNASLPDHLDGPGRTAFIHDMGRDARQVTDRELSTLLDSEWRSCLTAAWLIGLDRRTQFRDRIGAQLLESRLIYGGQGYCLALARFGTADDASLLGAYLNRHLPQADRSDDPCWAIGALLHLDQRLGTNRAGRFLTPGGLWDKSTASQYERAERHRHLTRLCAFADECMRSSDPECDTLGHPA